MIITSIQMKMRDGSMAIRVSHYSGMSCVFIYSDIPEDSLILPV